MGATIRAIGGGREEWLAFEAAEDGDGVIQTDAKQACRLRRRHFQPGQREKFIAKAKRVEISGFGERNHGRPHFPACRNSVNISRLTADIASDVPRPITQSSPGGPGSGTAAAPSAARRSECARTS